MSTPATAPGRRERNKQQKLERITAAATELFDRHGIDEVTIGPANETRIKAA